MTAEGASEAVPGRTYAAGLAEGRLLFQECGDCWRAVFFPRVACPHCGGRALRYRESRGFGTVYATTSVYRRSGEPYDVSLIDLDEGFRMMSRVDGPPAEDVEVGMRVRFAVETVDGEPVAVFRPAANGDGPTTGARR
ncbi:MAG: hypothetical protein GEV03_07340 [Streptosporangiales bacterium]|nr:hypothetical protein [Streptosporangiales bacterium]